MIMDDGVCSMLMLNDDWCFWYYGPCSGVAQRHCKVSWPQKRRSFRYESVWGWWCRYIYDDLWCMIYQGGSSWKKLFSISDVKKIRRLWGPNRIELCIRITWTGAASTKLCCIVGLEWSAWKGGTGAIWPGKQKKKLHRCISIQKNIKIILEGSSLGFGDWALLATGFLHSWLNGKPLAYALANGAYVGAPGMGTTTRTTVRIRRGNLLWSSFEVATAKLQSSLGARSFLSSSAPTWQSERYQEGDDQKIGCNIFLCVHVHSPVCIVIQHVFRHSDSGHVLNAPAQKMSGHVTPQNSALFSKEHSISVKNISKQGEVISVKHKKPGNGDIFHGQRSRTGLHPGWATLNYWVAQCWQDEDAMITAIGWYAKRGWWRVVAFNCMMC